MRIMQVSPRDQGGGAEHVAWNLFQQFRTRGHESWLVVGKQTTSDPHVLRLKHSRGPWARLWHRGSQHLVSRKFRGAWRLSRLAEDLAEPRRTIQRLLGHEDFYYPATGRLLHLTPHRPEILHCHNLHGGFFDLRMLPEFTRQLPVVLTLHDAWLLSGHCSHSFDCDRWQNGCGQCPDLSIYPPLERDGTAYNWRRKRELYARSRLQIITPSAWLMDKVEASVLMEGAVGTGRIPYGIDLEIFKSSDRHEARRRLGLPVDALILLFSAASIRENMFKDYDTLRNAMHALAEHRTNSRIIFVALGANGLNETIHDEFEIRFVPYQPDPIMVARYYQSANLYLHAARADTFPLAVMEALACGAPVIATAVGGIPEQIRSLDICGAHPAHPVDRATGILVPVGDAEAMAQAVLRMMNHKNLMNQLSRNASRDAQKRFDLEIQVQAYLDLYERLLNASADTSSLTK